MKCKLNPENLSKIINAEVVPLTGRLKFDIDSAVINIARPYIDDEGYEMGNSILMDDNDETIIFIRLSDDVIEVLFRENEGDNFKPLAQDSPASVSKFAEQTWYKIVDRFDAFEHLTINPSFTFDAVFGIINSKIVPNNQYGWRFEINEATVAIQKTFIDEEDGAEMGDSIHIDNDGGLLFYIQVSKPNEAPFLAIVYKENDEDEFVEMNNESPKRVIYFFNTIWDEIVARYNDKMERLLTYDKFSAQFGKYEIPGPLKALFEFESQFSLEQSFSEGFYLEDVDKSGLRTWSENEEFLDNIIEFASANYTGSSYAFWKINDDLNVCPIVVFGDEGGCHIVAENILGLMQLLTYDTEVSVDYDQVYFYKNEDDYQESENLSAYINWLKQNFNLDLTENPELIIEKAQEKYKEQFDKWTRQYFAEDSESEQINLTNEKVRNYSFLSAMYRDTYFPDQCVDKGKQILIELCFQIEQSKPENVEELYQLTHSATDKFNDLQEDFEENDSEIETVARDCIGSDFEFIAHSYGFEDADIEELIGTRDW